MTKMLEKAFAEASRLPTQDQDELAAWLLEELKAERRWAELLAQPSEFLDHLASQAIDEHRKGQSEPLDPERL